VRIRSSAHRTAAADVPARHPSARAVRQGHRPKVGVRDRLLDAAERLFADNGFSGVSVRQIVTLADANLGSVTYYFSTKENLFKETILRRAGPLNDERKRRLDKLVAGGRKPDVAAVLEAMLLPAFRATQENTSFRKLLGRAAMDPTPEVRRVLAMIYNPDFVVLPRALRISCRELPDPDFYWRLMCVLGAMLYVQSDTGRIQTITGKAFDTSQPEVALKYILPFLAAGMEAPAANAHSVELRRKSSEEDGAGAADIGRPIAVRSRPKRGRRHSGLAGRRSPA
jgi:AcrR family transcriptional regulator